MKVSELMTHLVTTVRPTTKIVDAFNLMVERQIRHLPIVDDQGEVWGIISDRDMRSALNLNQAFNPVTANYLSDIEVRDICNRQVIYATPETDIREAAKVLLKFKIGALPILDDREDLIGIVTETDLLAAFVEMLGVVYDHNRAQATL